MIAAAAADGNIEYQVIEEVIDPTDSLPAIRDFASQGYDLIIGHGIEYVDPIQQLWAEFPDVDFAMAGGILIPGSVTTPNVADWLYNTQDMAWPNGVLTANALVGDTIGIVGGPEFDFVKGMHQSYRDAVLSVNPDVEFLEGFAGSFIDVQRAAEVAQQHIDQGADLIYCSGDGICIGAAQAASAAGIPIAVGFGSQEQAAPDAYLSATVIRLDGLYGTWFDQVRDGSFGTSEGEFTFGEEGYAFFPSGIFNGQVEVMPVNMNATVETAVPLAELQAIMDDFVASVQNGEFMIPFPGAVAEEVVAPVGDSIKVALLLPGVKNDNSFSQAGYEGLIAAAAADGNIEYQVIEEVIDPTDSLPAIRDFASQGYDLIIGHGIEYVDPIQQLWAEFPDVDFAMAGGILIPGSVTTPNVADWLYNTQDMAWPNGVLTANALVGDTIGIVGGPEFDFVKGMHQSYRDAVLSVNPDVEFLEGFAGSFIDVQRAAEVAQQHIDQGADLIYCSGDGICIGAAQAASAAGIPIAVGFGSQEQAAPDAYLSATVIRLDGLYGTWFDQVRDGSFGTSEGEFTFGEEGYAFFPSGIFNGQVEVMPVNMNATVETAVPLAELQAIMDDFVASVQNGEFMIPFAG